MTRTLVAVAAVLCLSTPVHADVERGDTGPEVRQVQEHLRWYGYSVAVDGQFGRQTERAVRHYQRSNRLTADGVVGPLTAAALGIRGEQITVTQPPAPPVLTVEQIIRAAWPDHLEDKALAIAWRESRWQPDARNRCCHGLFQIHWPVHREWLATVGVTSVEQLYDPVVNARIAYMVYQRSNGWGPWAL